MFVDVNGVSIHVESRGSGPDLLMVHGNGEDMHLFDEAVDILSDDFRIWLIDSRGHGSSSCVDEYHYMDMASDVIGIINALDIKRPCMFGYSDGGIIGLLTAISSPGILSGLITAGANTRPDMLDPDVYRECQEWNSIHNDPRMTMMLTEPHIGVDDLSRISVPTVVMAGSDDCILREDTDRIAASIPCSKEVIVDGHDHSSYIEDGALLSKLMMEAFTWIQKHRIP